MRSLVARDPGALPGRLHLRAPPPPGGSLWRVCSCYGQSPSHLAPGYTPSWLGSSWGPIPPPPSFLHLGVGGVFIHPVFLLLVSLFVFPPFLLGAIPSFSHPSTFWVTHLPALPASKLCKLAHPVLVISSTPCTVKSSPNHLLTHPVTPLPRHAPFLFQRLKNWNSVPFTPQKAQYSRSHTLLCHRTTFKVRLGLEGQV